MQGHQPQEEPTEKHEGFVDLSNKTVLFNIKALSVIMLLLIVASLIDVVYVFYAKIRDSQPLGVLGYEGVLAVLGSALIVLICVEIYNNITLYLTKDNKSHVKLVLATALIAVSRKVIILDYSTTEPAYLYATGALVVATGIAYWLVASKT